VQPCVDAMTQVNLFKYFKASSSSQVALPLPNGPLSREVPSTAISEANKEVEEAMARDSVVKEMKLSEVHTKTEGHHRKLHTNKWYECCTSLLC